MFSNTWFEDDGIAASPAIAEFTISYSCTQTTVFVELEAHLNGYEAKWKELSIILPRGDKRNVEGKNTVSKLLERGDDRARFSFRV